MMISSKRLLFNVWVRLTLAKTFRGTYVYKKITNINFYFEKEDHIVRKFLYFILYLAKFKENQTLAFEK